MSPPHNTTRAGFTLIELSIVLVILGLLVGGVLAGRDLIHAARIRKVLSKKEQIAVVNKTFETKYDCLPGDCAAASTVLPGMANGNGDGKLQAMFGTPANGIITSEEQYFWLHLNAAGLTAYKLGQAPYNVGGTGPFIAGGAYPRVSVAEGHVVRGGHDERGGDVQCGLGSDSRRFNLRLLCTS